MIFYGVLSDVKIGSDDLVRLSLSYTSKHFELSRCQGVIGSMFGKLLRDLIRNASLSRVNTTDRINKLISKKVLEKVASRTRAKSSEHLNVARGSRQYDNPRPRTR